MNQATNVNIVPSYGQRGDLHFSQYDVGRTATISLYAVNEAYTIPVGATVKIQATKPSGLGFDVACTFSGSVVTVVSTETMTEESGRFPCELQITKDSDVIGTANFMFCVEASPHPDGTVDGDAEEVVNEIKALVLESEGYALGTQDGVPVDSSSVYYHNNAKWFSDNAVLSDDVKQALLQCFEKVAWIDGDGQTYYDALQTALNRGAELLSISAVYTQGGTVFTTDSLDILKNDLIVTAYYDDQTSEEVISYTLSGTLTAGTSSITVSYGGKTTTFDVTVTTAPLYPLPDKTTTTSDYKLTTTRYGHVEFEVLRSWTLPNQAEGAVTNLKTGVVSSATGSGINNQSATFTIPANSQVVWGIENVTNSLNTNFQGNFRLANASTSLSGTGMGSGTHTSGNTVTATVTSSANIYYLFFYIEGSTLAAGTKLIFDLYVNIGGTRYI